MPDLPSTDALAGRVLAGRYKLDTRIASGGMAQVWQATDQVLTRPVAVKLLHPHLAADASFVERFRREAIAAARLAHPSIVSIYDTCTDGDVEAIVMELVRGTTLRKLLDEKGSLDPSYAVGIIAEVADALDAAHKAGLVHRDVKPANILLSNDGRVLVADFGIAKAAEGADLTGTGTTLGTAKYLAPEQVRGEPVDARADVYALGIVLYECLCGRPPFVADNEAATALARLQQDPLRPRNVKASIPKPLEDVVLRALAREPAGRYATAGDLRVALLSVSRGSLPPPPTGAIPSAEGPDATVAVAPPIDRTSAVPGAPPPPLATRLTGAVPGAAPPARPRRRVMPAILIGLVAAALIVAGILLSGTSGCSGGDDTGSAPAGAAGVQISGAAAFDPPPGDGREGDASLAVDADPATAWVTEGYATRNLGGLKDGVGLAVQLASPTSIGSVRITSPTNDWAFSVYVADRTGTTLADWGQPVATQSKVAAGSTTVSLKGTKGSAVLIWITDLGDQAGASVHAQIAEVQVIAK